MHVKSWGSNGENTLHRITGTFEERVRLELGVAAARVAAEAAVGLAHKQFSDELLALSEREDRTWEEGDNYREKCRKSLALIYSRPPL